MTLPAIISLLVTAGLTCSLCVSAAAASLPLTLECEDGTLNHVNVWKDHQGFSGTGFVSDWNDTGASVSFDDVEMSADTPVTLTIRYSNGAAETKHLTLYVNGTKIKTLDFPTTQLSYEKWSTTEAQKATLKAGKNSIKIQKDDGDNGQFNTDNITVEADTTVSSAPASSVPASSAPSSSAPASSSISSSSVPDSSSSVSSDASPATTSSNDSTTSNSDNGNVTNSEGSNIQSSMSQQESTNPKTGSNCTALFSGIVAVAVGSGLVLIKKKL